MSDAELILVAGLLLAAAIAAAWSPTASASPACSCSSALGMLVGSEGLGGVEFDDAELTQTLGTIGLVLILFEGGLTAGWKEIRPGPRYGDLARRPSGRSSRRPSPALAATWLLDLSLLEGLILGSAIAATDSAAIFAVLRGSNAAAQARPLARGRVGDERPGRAAARRRVHRLDPDARLRRRRHGRRPRLQAGARGGARHRTRLCGPRRAFAACDLPTAGLYPVATIAAAAVAYGLAEVVARLRASRRLPDGR